MKFAGGIPLSCDQLNFLSRHERSLSNPHLDPVLKYYLKHYHHHYAQEHSFLSPNDTIDHDSVKRLKHRLEILLANSSSHVELKLKPADFLQFRALTYDELILYHGNQFLTGAPFFQGGIPQLIYFQWGNLFGVAKYVVLAEEKSLKSNVLIYFEDLQERNLQDCVYQYNLKLQEEMKQQLRLAPTLPKQAAHDEHQEPVYQPVFRIPRLSLSHPTEKREEE